MSTENTSTTQPAAPEQQMTTRRTWSQGYDPEKGATCVETEEQIPVEEPKAEKRPKRQRPSDIPPEVWKADGEDDDEPSEAERAIERERVGNFTPEQLGLQVPETLEGPQAAEAQEYLGDLTPIVAERGIDAGEFNTLVSYATDLVLTDPSGTDLLDRNAAEVHARNYFGESYEKTVDLAQRAADKLGESFKQWLRADGKGNHPGVISALAAWESGLLKMSPATAQEELRKMMAPGSPYMRGDRNAVNRARLLSELAERTTSRAPAAATAMRTAPDPTASLAAERQRLMHSPAFLDKNNPQHKATLERYKAVTEALYGEELSVLT